MNQSTSIADVDFASLAELIDSRYLTEQALADLGTWFRGTPTRPMVLRNFLRPEIAEATAAAMGALPVWSRCCTVFADALSTADIPESEWAKHPDRVACHFVARPLLDALEPGAMSRAHQGALKRFITFAVISGQLRSWIGAGIGVPLEKRTSVELAAYGPADQIRPHQDLIPGRIVAVNFYLDPDYRLGTGARLGYRNELNQEFAVDPLFNSFSLIPIGPQCHHWVEPFQDDRRGRYTVSIGEHREN